MLKPGCTRCMEDVALSCALLAGGQSWQGSEWQVAAICMHLQPHSYSQDFCGGEGTRQKAYITETES